MSETILNETELITVNGGAYSGPCIRYLIKRGDTLCRIAERFGTTVDTLVQLNNIANRNRIYAGRYLWVPQK